MDAALAQLSLKERTIFESHRPQIREAISAFHAGDYAHSDCTSLQLLACTTLPTCWRGACHLLLATLDCGSAELTTTLTLAKAKATRSAAASSPLLATSPRDQEAEAEADGTKTPSQRDHAAAATSPSRPPLPPALPKGFGGGGPTGGPRAPASHAFVLDHARAAYAAYKVGVDEAPDDTHRRKLFNVARAVLEVVDAEVFAVRDLGELVVLQQGEVGVGIVARKGQHWRRGELVSRGVPLEGVEWGVGEGEEYAGGDGGGELLCELREDWEETKERLSCVGCWR